MVISQNFSDRLKSLRLKKKLKQNEFAKLVNITPQYVFKLENHKIKKPPYRLIEIIATVLDTSPEFLINGSQHYPLVIEINSDNMFRLAPVLKWNEIGDWVNLGEAALLERVVERERIDKDNPKSCYVLKIENDIMQSKESTRYSFFEGDKIVINPDLSPINGQFVICFSPALGHTYPVLRQYINDGSGTYLKCLNEKYPTESIVNTLVQFMGVVVEKHTKF